MTEKEQLMQPDQKHSYDFRRAEAELRMADAARTPAAARAHYELAHLHLDRAHGAGPDRAGDSRP